MRKNFFIVTTLLVSSLVMSFKTANDNSISSLEGSDGSEAYVLTENLNNNLDLIMSGEDIELDEVTAVGESTGKKVIICPGKGRRCDVEVKAGNIVYVIHDSKAIDKPHVLIVSDH